MDCDKCSYVAGFRVAVARSSDSRHRGGQIPATQKLIAHEESFVGRCFRTEHWRLSPLVYDRAFIVASAIW